ncbi:MAG: polysaccharide export protein [Sphingomonadales bacterium]|nr:MAG: polysaccharide export protein [Sphingomonadales bacterium]
MRSLVVILGLVLTACSSPGLVDTGRVAIVTADALPAPTEADFADGLRRSTLGPGDTLSVVVFGLPELSAERVVIDSNGELALPVAGVLTASGKTPSEVSGEVFARLRASGVRDPRIAVNIVESVSQTVTLDGEVRRPGIYPIPGRPTMLRAIARAEGTTADANPNHVVVFRTIGTKRMAALYDLRAIRMGAYEDPSIYPNDVIVVGESAARRLFPLIAQTASVLVTPLVYLLR